MAVAIVVYIACGGLGRAAQFDGVLRWIRFVRLRVLG